MNIKTNEPVLQNGSVVGVFWFPSTILPIAKDPESYTIDITLRQQDLHSGEWTELTTLASNLTNNGSARIAIPELEFDDDNVFHPVIIEVGVSSVSTTNSRQRRNTFSNILTKIGEFGLRVLKQAPMRIIKKLIRQAAQRIACDIWANTGSKNIGQEINNRLPPCPCTSTLASEPTSGFKEEKLSSIFTTAGRVQNFLGITIIDDAFRQYFHPGTARCYRQRVLNP